VRSLYPETLRASCQQVLWPLAAAAPVPLPWTGSVSWLALGLYEAALLFFFWRARGGRPAVVSNALLNIAALLYVFFFIFEIRALHHGLVKTASHLLLFTAAAKFGSLRSGREMRTTLLLSFFLILDSASTSTNVASLLYLLLVAVLAFRVLARLAVLADFDAGPPGRVLFRIPTRLVSILSVAGAAALSVPLFLILPRLRNPFATVPIPKESDDSSLFTSDRVDLAAFSAEKRSAKIVLRVSPVRGDVVDPLRLRETSFNRYRDGRWWREGMIPRRLAPDQKGGFRLDVDHGGPAPPRSLGVEMSSLVSGFLFVPYGAGSVALRQGQLTAAPDSTLMLLGGGRGARYVVDYFPRVAGEAEGKTTVPLHDVPKELVRASDRIVQGVPDRLEIARKLMRYFETGFVYTLDPPKPQGEPVVDFVMRTRAGHCEYFASALALMLRAQGVPARLVSGSLGGEVGPFSSEILVRGEHLHAWVEADLDGTGFRVLDPTPPSGRPGMTAVSLWKKLAQLGNEVEFFYDRNILGFNAFDQASLLETVRDFTSRTGALLRRLPRARPRLGLLGLAGLLLLASASAILLARRRARNLPPAAAVYLRLRALYRHRIGSLPDSAPSSEVVGGFASRGREAAVAARRIVEIYRREAFGGIPADPGSLSEIKILLSRLKKLAAAAALLLCALARLEGQETPAPTPLTARYEDLKQLQARVEESRKKLAQLQKRTAGLREEVEGLDLSLQIASGEREVIAAKRDDLARQNAAISQDLEGARRARGAAASTLRGRIVLLSRLGRFGYLRVLLSARQPAELVSALRSLDAMARADSAALSRFTETSRRLERDLEIETQLKKEADALYAEDREQERRIAQLRQERLQLLARSQSETIETKKEVVELADKAQKLEALLDLLSKGESTLTGSPRPWKGVLDWPAAGKIAVTFGRHRHPKFDAWTVSNGIEILAPDGDPVKAVYNGKVVFARWFADYGNMVVLDHGDEVLSLYARLRNILVRVGDLVNTGDRIGLVGTGPGENEPSLYFEVRDRQKASDPLAWLR
jgi:septal ring factor EnvC (AmiA/AmiB activator)